MEEEFKISKNDKEYIKEVVKLTEGEIKLTEGEIQKIERVCAAIEHRYNAEASKEAHQKMRILFERTAKEHLPFIIYCIYMGVVGVAGFVNIDKIPEHYLPYYLVALVLVTLVPISILFIKRKGKNESEIKTE